MWFSFQEQKNKVSTKPKLTHAVLMCMCVGILPHLCADSFNWPTSETSGRSLNVTHVHCKRIVWFCVEERESNLALDWFSSVWASFDSLFAFKPKWKKKCNAILLAINSVDFIEKIFYQVMLTQLSLMKSYRLLVRLLPIQFTISYSVECLSQFLHFYTNNWTFCFRNEHLNLIYK